MKKCLSVLMAAIMLFSFAACSNSAEKNKPETTSNTTAAPSAENTEENHSVSGKTLVVYFSVPDDRDNSYVERNGEKLVNTQFMAQIIQENANADIFRIIPKTPYTTNHEELLTVAQNELKTNARPEIAETIENFEEYSNIFIGYPIWNADLPNILYTFFETYDFSGKTIIPFSTHGGSGFAGTPQVIAELEPNAAMLDGMSISRNEIENAENDIKEWVKSLDV